MSVNLNINAIGRKRRRFPSVLLDGNTVAWYNSQLLSTITKDGSDFVSRWNDRLGSGHDLIQSTGTNQPKWFSVNGVLFDGIDNFMKTSPFTFDQPEMIYIVLKQVTWTLGDYILDGISDNRGAIFQSATTPGLKSFAGAASGQNNNLVLNTFGIVRILFNGASSKLQINETTATTGNLGSNNMGGILIGSIGSGASSWGNIQAKEAIYRKVADGTSDEQNIYNYLKNKYGIL